MKSTVEHLSPTRVKLAVEVPFDELKPNFDRAYKKIAQQVRIPGFRPGKAPARILDQRLGRGVVLEEVVNEAVPAKYGEAVERGRGPARSASPTSRSPRSRTATSSPSPPRSTSGPRSRCPTTRRISVSVDAAEVTDDDVDDQLKGLQARFGTLTGVDRPAANGDFVVIDLAATVDGEAVEEAQTTGMSHEVGSGQLIEGLDEALDGHDRRRDEAVHDDARGRRARRPRGRGHGHRPDGQGAPAPRGRRRVRPARQRVRHPRRAQGRPAHPPRAG